MQQSPTSPLVSAGWLEAQSGHPALLRLDLRVAADGGRAAYEAAHVPGAVYSDYAGDGWRRRDGDVPGLLPKEEHLSALFARLGITPGTHVILIPAGTSANDFAASARAYWTLKVSGHRDVSILNGGTKGWIAEGRAVETGWREPAAASLYPVRPVEILACDCAKTDAARRDGSHRLVDARAASYYEGREKASEAKRAGHIPGAVSLDYARAFDAETGRLRPHAELAALYAAVPEGPVISYCNTGHTAALNWFVMHEVLGRDVALYAGSMTAWTQDDTRPVATM
jgi:thiosulfate/3-mercaptopyruvate sulfurtransferase